MLVQIEHGDNVRVKVTRVEPDNYLTHRQVGDLLGITFYLRDRYIYITAFEWEQLKEMVDG